MRPQMDEDVQVAARTAAEPGLALAGDPQPHAAVNSRRDAHRDCALRRGPAAPAALGAGIAEDRPGPAAGTAGGDLHEGSKQRAVWAANFATAPAGRALRRGRFTPRSGPQKPGAGLQP